MDELILYLAHLMKCAVTGETPQAIPDGISLSDIVRYAHLHSIDCCVFTALSRLGADKEDPAFKQLSEWNNAEIMRDTYQQHYLSKIAGLFEKNGIDSIILKGGVLKEIYPETYLRQSCDLDILTEDTEKAADVMKTLGFSVDDYDNDNSHHDVFILKPYLVVELHRKFMRREHTWSPQFAHMKERKIPYKNYSHVFQLSVEDSYLFMLAHMAKHVKYSGIGMKAVLDIWLFKKHYAEISVSDELKQIIEASALTEFESSVDKLCKYWFEGAAPDDITKDFSRLMFTSGSYGNAHNVSSENAYETSSGKFAIYLKSFFSPAKSLQHTYPILIKHKWLLPFIWIRRGMRIVFRDKKAREQFVENTNKADAQLGKKLNDIKNNIGL